MKESITAEFGFECHPKLKTNPHGKVRANYLLLAETKERLTRAKKKLNMAETACVEDALRDWFRKREIE